MNRSLLVAGGFAAAALCSGLLVWLVLASPRQPPPSDPAVEQRLAELERRIGALTEENRQLRASSPPAEPPVPSATRAASDPERRGEPTPTEPAEEPLSPQEQATAWEATVVAARVRRAELLTALATEAELSSNENAAVSQLLLDEQDQATSLFRAARAGELSFFEASKASKELRHANDSTVRSLLTEEQFALFQALRLAENQRPDSPAR